MGIVAAHFHGPFDPLAVFVHLYPELPRLIFLYSADGKQQHVFFKGVGNTDTGVLTEFQLGQFFLCSQNLIQGVGSGVILGRVEKLLLRGRDPLDGKVRVSDPGHYGISVNHGI